MEGKSIKETKDILKAIDVIATEAIRASKDGLDFGDVKAIFKCLDDIKVAIDNCDEVPEELRDLSRVEIAELVNISVQMVFNVMDELKK